MVFKVGLNFGGNQIVRYLHRKVCHRFEPDANRRLKLIAMAKECASRLCIGDWNVLLWDPEFITMDMLEILAASKICSSLEGATQVAWLLGGNDIIVRKVVKHFIASDIDAVDVVKVTIEHLETFQNDLALALGKWSGASVLKVFLEKFGCNPLQQYLIPSESLTPEIRNEWNNALDYLKNLNRENGQILSSPDDIDGDIDEVEVRVQRIFFASLMVRFGMSSFLYGGGILVNYPFRVNCYVRNYIHFLLQFLQSKSGVGKRTNFARMRRIHVSNCAPPPPAKTVWEVFTTSLESRRKKVQVDGTWTWALSLYCFSMRRPVSMPNVDLLDVMRTTLGGQESDVANIQESILDSLLGAKEVRKDTLQGRISRRKVHLLRCGEDSALVLPYLNKIVLQLNDDRWVRDHDLEALQPCRGEYDEGAIRRTSNVMLAFDYPNSGDPMINDTAYRILYQHARKGELYSKHLRNRLLSLKDIEHRVDIRALEARAREVFKDNDVMIAALTREMMHDILVTKSDFGEEAMIRNSEIYRADRSRIQVTRNGGAYYDTFYASGGIPAWNNILWATGVPLLGLSIDYTLTRAGQLDGQEMHGVAIVRRFDGVKVVIWIPARSCRDNDSEVPTGFIENRECVDGKVIEPLSSAVPNNGPTFDNFRVGGYCRFNFDIGAPPEKQRKKAGPSNQVQVDGIQLLLDALKVTNAN